MAFTLAQAVELLRKSSYWSERPVRGEPVAGDPQGTTFHILQPPARPGTLSLRFTSGSPVPTTFYTFDPDTGVITTVSPPPLPMLADYVAQELTDAQLEAACREALLEVEARITRGYRWSAPDMFAELVDFQGQEPTVPEGPYSASGPELALFLAAAEYCLVKNLLKFAAATFYYYRTGTGGTVIDRRDQPRNLREALRELAERLDRIAQDRAARLGPGTIASWEVLNDNVGAWWNRALGAP